jgi:uncharacterized protein involved in outer membrane biogenesis
LLILVAILIIAIFILTKYIDLNDYKSEIAELFQQKFNYILEINGNINWSMDNKLKLAVNELKVKDHNSSENLLQVKRALIVINPVTSILSQKLMISDIELEDCDVHLISHENNQENIDKLLIKLKKHYAKLTRYVSFKNFVIKNSNFRADNIFTDPIIIGDINLIWKGTAIVSVGSSTINILQNQLVVDGLASFDFEHNNFEFKRFTIKNNDAYYNLDGKMFYRDNKWTGESILKLVRVENVEKVEDIFLNAKFDISDKQINLEKINLKTDTGELLGELFVDLPSHKGTFKITANNVQLEKIIAAMHSSELVTNTAIYKQYSKQNPVDVVLKSLKNIQLNGSLVGDNVMLNKKLKFNKLDLNVESDKPGMFKLKDSKFKFARGNVAVKLDADFRKELKFKIDARITDLNMRYISNIFTKGKGIIDLKLSSNAQNTKSILENLQGNLDIVVAKGKISGVDFYGLLMKVEKHLQQQFDSLKNNPNQNFADLTQKEQIVSNVIDEQAVANFDVLQIKTKLKKGADSKSSIVLKYSAYNMEGKGSIDLAKNNLDYVMQVDLLRTPRQLLNPISQYMQVNPLKVQATGKVNKIVFTADLENYLLVALKKLNNIAGDRSNIIDKAS